MRVKVNGQDAELEAGLSLDRLLLQYKLKRDMVVVELNRAVPAKELYSRLLLKEGDEVEIVKFMGGG